MLRIKIEQIDNYVSLTLKVKLYPHQAAASVAMATANACEYWRLKIGPHLFPSVTMEQHWPLTLPLSVARPLKRYKNTNIANFFVLRGNLNERTDWPSPLVTYFYGWALSKFISHSSNTANSKTVHSKFHFIRTFLWNVFLSLSYHFMLKMHG